MSKKRLFLNMGLAAVLLGSSIVFGSCGNDDDDPLPNGNGQQTADNSDKPGNSDTPGNSDNPEETVLVSELRCTVAEFASKYQTLKKGEKVTVTLTDVSNANLADVANVLRKMSQTQVSKSGDGLQYLISLILECLDGTLTEIPADVFKDCQALLSITIPDSVLEILANAFAGCVNLEAASIPENANIAADAFDGCKYQPEQKEDEPEVPEEPKELAFLHPIRLSWGSQDCWVGIYVKEDWVSLKLVFDTIPSSVYYSVLSDFMVEDGFGRKVNSRISYPIDSCVVDVDLAAALETFNGIEGDESTKIVDFYIRNNFSGFNKCILTAAVATKKDGSQELCEKPRTGWNSGVEVLY